MEKVTRVDGQDVIECSRCESNQVHRSIGNMAVVGIMLMILGVGVVGGIFEGVTQEVMAYIVITGVLMVMASALRSMLPINPLMRCNDCKKTFTVSK